MAESFLSHGSGFNLHGMANQRISACAKYRGAVTYMERGTITEQMLSKYDQQIYNYRRQIAITRPRLPKRISTCSSNNCYTKVIYLVSLLSDCESATDFGRATTVHDPVVADQVTDDTQCIVHTALGLLDDLANIQSL